MSDVSENNATDKTVNKKKKVSGLFIIALFLSIWMIASYRPEIPKIYCDEATLAEKPEVIMFGTWWCPYCYQARRYLHNNETSYCEYDIEKSAEGKRRYDETRATAIPALIIGKYLLQGFDEASIDKALILSRENNEPNH